MQAVVVLPANFHDTLQPTRKINETMQITFYSVNEDNELKVNDRLQY